MYLTTKKLRWTAEQIAAAKAAVKGHLDAVTQAEGIDGRFRAISLKASELEADTSSQGQLQRFIYVMSSLVHHERHNNMTPPQVRRAADLARSILRANGVELGRSSQSTLHTEIHLILSQIHRRNGDHWSALCEQLVADYIAPPQDTGTVPVRYLATAERLLRTGLSDLALVNFRAALACTLSPSNRNKALMGVCRALRLSGQPEAATDQLKAALNEDGISEALRLDLGWDQLCLEVQATSNVMPLVATTRKGKPHYSATYIIEAGIWCKVVPAKTSVDLGMKCATLATKSEMNPNALGFFFEAAKVLDQCYDTEVPILHRIQDLAEIIPNLHQALTMGQELLIWAAACRFLSRIKAFDFAAVCVRQYESLCRKLSSGARRDILGVLEDILDRDWLAKDVKDDFIQPA